MSTLAAGSPETPPGEIRSSDEGTLRWLTIDNPARKNALSVTMLESLREALHEAQRSTTVRAVAIRGAGGAAFCAGFDLTALRSGVDADQIDATMGAAYDAIASCGLPVIAVIDGWCIGAGLELALTCDLRVCTPASRFRLPAGQLGITYPERGLARCVAAVGRAQALRIALLSESFDADEAARMGFVHAVEGEPSDLVTGWAERITKSDRNALANMKTTLTRL